MRIENEMLSRLTKRESLDSPTERSISCELDFFFDNVMDTVVDFFNEREKLRV
ncbi:MAG: hypothetical protein MJ230_05685 [bacterium]|nr:hypothetical protein [bacterium]